MRVSTTLLLLAACTLTLAKPNAHGHGNPSVKRHSNRRFLKPQPHSKRATYKLTQKSSGNSFFDDWDFWDLPDPTHGTVNYLNKADAQNAKLTYVQDDGTVVIAVDDYTQLKSGQNRNSVRITSKRVYHQGLFVIDLYAMPHGCSVWPAFWTTGSNWPHDGEIDIIEGVHENTQNQYTLHTSSGCSTDTSPPGFSPNKAFQGKVLGTKCESSNGNNDGCAFLDWNTASYGHGFNMNAGGVYAMLWDDEGIKTWHFPRGTIPADISSFSPDPSGWPTPAAFWSFDSCSAGHFTNHSMIIDTTLCGDWAGATFSSAGCGNSCADFVADPNNFKLAKWMINYVATYST